MLHHVNDASFALPEQLKDRTTHTFVSFDEEAGEFSVVMSHAEVQADTTLAGFADDLIAGLSKAMPDFSLLGSTQRTLADKPAIEFAYSWRNRVTSLHQRQLISLVPGDEAGERQALLIAASCPREFAAKWDATFESVLSSVKLRDRTRTPEIQVTIPPTINAATVFALCAGRRTLHAFADQDEACLNTDAYEVQESVWRFFDAAGKPLRVSFVVPRAWWRKPGKYVLAMQPEDGAPFLREQLHRADTFDCHSPSVGLSSMTEVRTTFGHFSKE